MEKCILRLARRMLGLQGAYEYQGSKRQRPNKEIRNRMKISSVVQD